MLSTFHPPVTEAFAQVLETMAFITVEPVDAPANPPARLLLASIEFAGPLRGVVELVASREFAVLLAANVLGCSTLELNPASRADDALKELVNVVCGDILAKLPRSQPGLFELGIPKLVPFDAGSEWRHFVATSGSAVFAADEEIVAIRVRGLR